ncbi:MAG TPA: Gfo/Idh/MocA family oxidoreductase, partial [Candidatus Saccharimonadales bacterium]|nr:Gfo/Idh/MocA family oxidoreductase [Candidatus Saccharimonadales bacterium]
MKQLRFGILSAADIARKNWESIFHSGNSIVTAVASRDVARSRRFIQELQSRAPFIQAPLALGSYEELLASPDVDAVYIPLPTGLRKEWVLRAAAAEKHVICEKPCGVSLADVQEMINACAKNRVQFMDGVMFM